MQHLLSCNIGIAYFVTAGTLVPLSLLTVTVISFDHFLAVHLGLNYRKVTTMKRMKAVVLLLRLIRSLVGMIYVVDYSTTCILMLPVICLCMLFATCNYLAIAKALRSQREITVA